MTKHGEAVRGKWTPEYRAWVSMKTRCYGKSRPSYQDYGARGIGVCPAWLVSYTAFRDHIGSRPSKHYSLDRIKNELGYQSGNVRWTTRTGQQRNKRVTCLVTAWGITQPLAAWCEQAGLRYHAVWLRLFRRYWLPEKALAGWSPWGEGVSGLA